jgi:hypothetical protein
VTSGGLSLHYDRPLARFRLLNVFAVTPWRLAAERRHAPGGLPNRVVNQRVNALWWLAPMNVSVTLQEGPCTIPGVSVDPSKSNATALGSRP